MVHNVNLEDVQAYMSNSYQDGDIIIFNNQSSSLTADFESLAIRMNDLILCYCIEGTLTMKINGNETVMRESDLLFWAPAMVLSELKKSDNFKGYTVGISRRVLSHIFYNGKSIMDLMIFIAQHPVQHLDLKGSMITQLLNQLIEMLITEKKRPYHGEIMQGLIQAAMYYLFSEINLPTERISADDRITQGDQLVRKFMMLLNEIGDRERSVAAYAEKLCITPKYLTSVCKQKVGKSAIKIIEDHVKMIIEYRLKHSEESIKEISTSMNFPSISFFGKYTKRCLGISPSDYRKKFNK